MAALAHIVRLGAVLGKRGDLCAVLSAVRAENADGIVVVALPFRRVLRAVGIEDIEDLFAVFQRKNDVLSIPAAAVFLRLEMKFHFDTEVFQRGHELLFKMGGVAFAAAERIGNVRIRMPDVLFKGIVAQMVRNVFGDFAQAVVLVPGKEEFCLFAPLLQSAIDEIAGGYVAEIADVYGTRRGNARRAHIFCLVGIAADDLVRQFVCPVHNNSPE